MSGKSPSLWVMLGVAGGALAVGGLAWYLQRRVAQQGAARSADPRASGLRTRAPTTEEDAQVAQQAALAREMIASLTADAADPDDAATRALFGGGVTIHRNRTLYPDSQRRGLSDSLRDLFSSNLYMNEYGRIPPDCSEEDKVDAFVAHGDTLNAAQEMKRSFEMLKTVIARKSAEHVIEPRFLRTMFNSAFYVREYSDRESGDQMFQTVFDQLQSGDGLEEPDCQRAITYLLSGGDAETALIIAQERASTYQQIMTTGATGEQLILGVLAFTDVAQCLTVLNQYDEATTVLSAAIKVMKQLPGFPESIHESVLVQLSHVARWAGEKEAALTFLTEAREPAEHLNSMHHIAALMSGLEDEDQEPAIVEVSEKDIAQSSDNVEDWMTVPPHPLRPATAPRAIPPIATLSVCPTGQCVHAVFLFGPRDAASGALLTPRAEHVEMHVGVQFISATPVTTSPFIYIVGVLHVRRQDERFDSAEVMRWRVRTNDAIHTAIDLRSPPLEGGVRPGLHYLTLNFYGDAKMTEKIGSLRQHVWLAMDPSEATERESRALWRYLHEACGWREIISNVLEGDGMGDEGSDRGDGGDGTDDEDYVALIAEAEARERAEAARQAGGGAGAGAGAGAGGGKGKGSAD